MEPNPNIVIYMIAFMLLIAFFMYSLMKKVVLEFRKYRVKQAIAKIDMNEFTIACGDRYGIPKTLQSKKNPNQIIYI